MTNGNVLVTDVTLVPWWRERRRYGPPATTLNNCWMAGALISAPQHKPKWVDVCCHLIYQHVWWSSTRQFHWLFFFNFGVVGAPKWDSICQLTYLYSLHQGMKLTSLTKMFSFFSCVKSCSIPHHFYHPTIPVWYLAYLHRLFSLKKITFQYVLIPFFYS